MFSKGAFGYSYDKSRSTRIAKEEKTEMLRGNSKCPDGNDKQEAEFLNYFALGFSVKKNQLRTGDVRTDGVIIKEN